MVDDDPSDSIPGGYGGTASAGGASNNVRGNECEQTIFRALNILGLSEGVDFVHTKNIPYSDYHDSDSICEDFIFPNQHNPHRRLIATDWRHYSLHAWLAYSRRIARVESRRRTLGRLQVGDSDDAAGESLGLRDASR